VIGLGLIGLGKHGSRYARHIAEDPTDASLVAVCRRNRVEGEHIARLPAASSMPTTAIS